LFIKLNWILARRLLSYTAFGGRYALPTRPLIRDTFVSVTGALRILL
jgi:hypothetical protein